MANFTDTFPRYMYTEHFDEQTKKWIGDAIVIVNGEPIRANVIRLNVELIDGIEFLVMDAMAQRPNQMNEDTDDNFPSIGTIMKMPVGYWDDLSDDILWILDFLGIEH